jgi:hypothetical protein
MIKKFSDILQEVQKSEAYTTFIKEHPEYYLAHGFIQLDKEFATSKDWQLGFYSKEKDNLALFHTEPIKFVGFEDAFKEDGHIDELKFTSSYIDIDSVKKLVGGLLATEYSNEEASSFICILQTIDTKPLYNITAITSSLAMISIRIHAEIGEILSHKKSSILSLKKDDGENVDAEGEEE